MCFAIWKPFQPVDLASLLVPSILPTLLFPSCFSFQYIPFYFLFLLLVFYYLENYLKHLVPLISSFDQLCTKEHWPLKLLLFKGTISWPVDLKLLINLNTRSGNLGDLSRLHLRWCLKKIENSDHNHPCRWDGKKWFHPLEGSQTCERLGIALFSQPNMIENFFKYHPKLPKG